MQEMGTEVMVMDEHKFFYTAEDIASDLSISEEEAEGLVKELHEALKSGCFRESPCCMV